MKRGQAALEFIMTYGWAILVVLVMVSALAYFGVVNPKKLLPDQCSITAGINCADYQITKVGSGVAVNLTLENKMGKIINAAKLNGSITTTEGITIFCRSSPSAGGINPDTRFLLQCGYGGSGISAATGSPLKVKVALNYTLVDSAYANSVSGDLRATVQ